MGCEVVCPECGALVPLAGSDEIIGAPVTTEILIPCTASVVDISDSANGSGTELDLLAPGRAEPSVAAPAAESSGEVAVYDEPPPAPFDGTAGPWFAAPAAVESPPLVVDLVDTPAMLPAARAVREDIEEDNEPPRASPGFVLLASYASAMTLACIYLLWFAPRRPAGPSTLPGDSRPDLGDDRGGAVAAPIAPDRLARLGKPMRVGDLEWTPLEVKSGRVALKDQVEGGRAEDGGEALILRLRLKNVSPDSAFAPLERASVRRPDRGFPDSYIERDDGQVIDTYPLAVESERAIVGQSFEPLGPGESRETIVVSDKDASGRARGPLTWRLGLRVAPDRVETVGVSFTDADIQR